MSASTDTTTLRLAGRFKLQPHERRLLVDGNPTSVGARAFDLLRHFAERPGRLITKQELMDVVWHDVVVTDNNIQQQVSALRKLLGADAIETVPGLGYRFVAHVDALSPSAWPDAPPTTMRSVTAQLKTNLPSALTPLIGRERDLAALGALVGEHRLVTVIGAGGIGKSRLSQALLFGQRESHRHGVCLVDLSVTAEPDAVPGVIGAALGVSIGSGPDALRGLVDALAPLAMLIALDNAEHLVQAVAAMAEALHRWAPDVRLLVTSQVPLRIVGEQVYRLGPLDMPVGTPPAAQAQRYSALALFTERAHAADRRFQVTDDNVATVVEVCRRLDGVALPIELAAARVPLLGLPKLAASLDQRLRLLTAGSLTAPPRQQTLRAALEWSHGLLGEAEQKVFRRLAVFIGSASLEAAQQVAADDPPGKLDAWAVLDALGALVDRSLVAVVGDERRPRYRLLDTPRSFALERLRASGEEDAVRRRHVSAVRALFEPALDERYAGRVGIDDWRSALEPDCDNALAAVRWAVGTGDAASALAIAPAFHSVTSGSSQQRCTALWEVVEPLLDAPDIEAQAPIRLGRAAAACSNFLDVKHSLRAQARALQAIRALGASTDRIGLYVAYDRLCWPSQRIGDTAHVHAALEAMRSLEDPAWAPAVKVYRAECESYALFRAGDFDGATRWARRQAELEQAAGWSDSLARGSAIHVAIAAGRANEVLSEARALVAQLEAARNRRTLAFARFDLAAALLATGATDDARDVARDGWNEVGAFGMQAWWADEFALLAALESRPHAAARLAGYADALYAVSGEQRGALQAASVKRAMKLAADALGGATALRELQAEGAKLREDDIVELALGHDSDRSHGQRPLGCQTH